MVRTELYTSGGEFNLPNGKEYIGAYHVHFDKGAMVGGFHEVKAHDRLKPMNRAAEQLVQSIMKNLQTERMQEIAIKSLSSGTSSRSSSSGSGSSGGSGGY